MRKRYILGGIVALVLAAILTLTGCGDMGQSTGAGSGLGEIYYVDVETPHGTIPCVYYNGYQKGGLDCDWTVTHG